MLGKLDCRTGHYALLAALAACLFLVNLGGPSLWDVDEGRNATAAYEMRERGTWLVPTFNGKLRVDKPALLYWLQIAAYNAVGVNETGARLPSALAALLTVLVVYDLGRRLFNPGTGLLAGVVFASAPMVCGSARFANPDALLNLCTVLTLLLFWVGYETGARWPFIAVGVTSALGVLAKGPVGLVMPVAISLGFLAWTGKLRVAWRPAWLGLGTLAFVLVAAPWYTLVAVETKARFLEGFLLRHNVERYLSPMESHDGGPEYYVLVLLAGVAPWSVLLGPALWYGFWPTLARVRPAWLPYRQAARDDEATADQYRFLWCWVAGYLLFFTLSATKLPNYVLPLCAPVAVLLARYLDRWRRGLLRPPAWVLPVTLGCLAAAGAGLSLGLAVAGGSVELPPLRGPSFPGLGVWALLGLVPVAGAAAAWWCARRGRRTASLVSLALTALLTVGPFAAWGAAALEAHKAARPLVAEAGALDLTRDLRVGSYELAHLPSLNFYCRRTLAQPDDDAEALDLLRYPVPVYLFLPESAWERLAPHAGGAARVVARHPDLYRGGAVVAVTNR